MRTSESASVAGLLGAFILLLVSDAIARRASEHLRRYRRSHRGYVIAATAEAHDTPLAMLNVQHFPMFAGLTHTVD